MPYKYNVFRFNLSTALAETLHIPGGFVYIKEATDGITNVNIYPDSLGNDPINLRKQFGVVVEFNRLFVHAAAQPGKSIEIIITSSYDEFRIFEQAQLTDITSVGTVSSITNPITVQSISNPVTVAGLTNIDNHFVGGTLITRNNTLVSAAAANIYQIPAGRVFKLDLLQCATLSDGQWLATQRFNILSSGTVATLLFTVYASFMTTGTGLGISTHSVPFNNPLTLSNQEVIQIQQDENATSAFVMIGRLI